MDKQNVIHPYNGIVFRHKKKLNYDICYNIDEPWASLVAQLVKNLPAMREIWVRTLGWEDSLEKGKAIHSSILGLPLWLSW